jgi:hypothetical protein
VKFCDTSFLASGIVTGCGARARSIGAEEGLPSPVSEQGRV